MSNGPSAGEIAWRNSILRGLEGKQSHVTPVNAVSGLPALAADAAPPGGLHSAHRLLHHIVVWQEVMVAAISLEHAMWPTPEADWGAVPAPWDELVERFLTGLERAREVVLRRDLTAAVDAAWPDVDVGGALMVLITHNSYHLGQLVDARRATGNWPPG